MGQSWDIQCRMKGKTHNYGNTTSKSLGKDVKISRFIQFMLDNTGTIMGL